MSEEDKARGASVLDFEQHDQERARAFVQSRLNAADKIYSQAINGLFLGNSGAALAVLAFVGATWKDGRFPKVLLWPLAFFVFGVIAMGLGVLLALLRERRVITRNQNAESLLDIFTQDLQSPLQRVGLARGDVRMTWAIVSGFCFLVGCVVGFFLLLAT